MLPVPASIRRSVPLQAASTICPPLGLNVAASPPFRTHDPGDATLGSARSSGRRRARRGARTSSGASLRLAHRPHAKDERDLWVVGQLGLALGCQCLGAGRNPLGHARAPALIASPGRSARRSTTRSTRARHGEARPDQQPLAARRRVAAGQQILALKLRRRGVRVLRGWPPAIARPTSARRPAAESSCPGPPHPTRAL